MVLIHCAAVLKRGSTNISCDYSCGGKDVGQRRKTAGIVLSDNVNYATIDTVLAGRQLPPSDKEVVRPARRLRDGLPGYVVSKCKNGHCSFLFPSLPFPSHPMREVLASSRGGGWVKRGHGQRVGRWTPSKGSTNSFRGGKNTGIYLLLGRKKLPSGSRRLRLLRPFGR